MPSSRWGPASYHKLGPPLGAKPLRGTRTLALLPTSHAARNHVEHDLEGSPGAPETNVKPRIFVATVDPGGNPTTGITYSTNSRWYLGSGSYRGSLVWDTNRYMNVCTNSLPCCSVSLMNGSQEQ